MQELTSPQAGTNPSDQTCLLLAGWLRSCIGWYRTVDPNGATNMENMAVLLEDGLPMGRGMGSISIPGLGLGHFNISLSGREVHIYHLPDAVEDGWDPDPEDVLQIRDGRLILYREGWISRIDQIIRVINARATILKMTRRLSVHWERAEQCMPMELL